MRSLFTAGGKHKKRRIIFSREEFEATGILKGMQGVFFMPFDAVRLFELDEVGD